MSACARYADRPRAVNEDRQPGSGWAGKARVLPACVPHRIASASAAAQTALASTLMVEILPDVVTIV